ncbi:adenylyltransferase/cytidyltransferase family protein [Vibrio sp. Hep-1b-8]|uniref:adenylyltransferase/cytidyltransferase family protein n=1 Tax=Vibrio sp. Hep-1b-8 TaxID=2144187 RepID=UPI0011106C78|nr:adenylyltransferase/cytidyltransferase family protein [Vibrio sp. Hep-1b-8]TMX34359.1 glycerol-3-phosphate cytidylyltransferase [Vibrio sp. Hep-1b-8]
MKKVYTSGTYDLFHIGHLNVIKASKALGDYLVVGVSTDELVKSYKQQEPIISLADRIEIIRHLDCVDEVVVQEELFSVELMSSLDIDIMTIGDDWRNKSHPGLQWAIDNPSIEMVFLPYTQTVSTTQLKEKIRNGWQEDK